MIFLSKIKSSIAFLWLVIVKNQQSFPLCSGIHFLYKSLEPIQELVGVGPSAVCKRMLQSLAEFHLGSNIFLLKMKKGGMNEPVTLQQQTTVVRTPLSLLEIIPTCFFRDKIFGGFVDVVLTPVSCMLKIISGSILFFSKMIFNKS